MDKSWNFIIKDARKDEQKQLIDVFDRCGLLKKDKTFAEVKSVMQKTYGNQTYNDFLQSVINSQHIVEPKDKANLDTYVVSQIILPVLMQHEEMRIEFCKYEHFASSERKDFVREFNSRFRTSVIFKAKLPIYGLSLAGVNDDKSSFSRNSIISFGAMASAMLGGPIGLGLWSAYKMFSKVGETSKKQGRREQIGLLSNSLTPIYLVLIHIHILHTQTVDSLNKAKSFVSETIKYANNVVYAHDNFVFKGYYEWDDARLNLLLYFVTRKQESEGNSRIKSLIADLGLQCRHNLSEIIDDRDLAHLIPYKDELIDYLYGMKKAFMPSGVPTQYKGLTLDEEGKKWLVDFHFPNTPVDESTYFLVDPVQKQQYALTCLYLELKGIDSDTHCAYFDEGYQKRFEGLKEISKREEKCSPSVSDASGQIDCNELICKARCIRHGAGKLVPYIKDVAKDLLENKNLSDTDRDNLQDIINKCYKLHEFLSLLDDVEVGYSKPEKISISESLNNAFNDPRLKDVSIVYDIPQDTLVYIGKKEFEKHVLDNIVSNLYEHAFNNICSNKQVHIKVLKRNTDSVEIRICNNGNPLEVDVDKIFESYDVSNVPDNRWGTYLIRQCMEHYGGTVCIEQNADVVTYVLTLKTKEI